jgi:hypothetical protein
MVADYRSWNGRHILSHVTITSQSSSSLTLKAQVRVVQNKDAKTQYVAIPSVVVQDSLYPFQENDILDLEVHPAEKRMSLRFQRHETVKKKG